MSAAVERLARALVELFGLGEVTPYMELATMQCEFMSEDGILVGTRI